MAKGSGGKGGSTKGAPMPSGGGKGGGKGVAAGGGKGSC